MSYFVWFEALAILTVIWLLSTAFFIGMMDFFFQAMREDS